ncbi:MAG: hypothetical protein ACREET_15615, partial [Stellaceae bacterium]
AEDLEATAVAAADRAGNFMQRMFAAVADRIEAAIEFMANVVAPPPKPTREQAEIAAKVVEERAQDNADLAAYFGNEAARDRLLDGIRSDDAEQERQARLEGGRSSERDE